jgi:hypothetical protein
LAVFSFVFSQILSEKEKESPVERIRESRRPSLHPVAAVAVLFLAVLLLLRFSVASPWEGVLILLGGAFFARRHPLLAASAAAFIPAVSPFVQVLLAAMLLYSLFFPLIKRFFGAASDPPAATAALLSCLAAFWLPLPAAVFSSGLLCLALLWRSPPHLDENGMISAILAGISFLLALPLYYL